MSIKAKLLILFVAVFVSLLVFNLIASSFVSLVEVDREANCDTIESCLALKAKE